MDSKTLERRPKTLRSSSKHDIKSDIGGMIHYTRLWSSLLCEYENLAMLKVSCSSVEDDLWGLKWAIDLCKVKCPSVCMFVCVHTGLSEQFPSYFHEWWTFVCLWITFIGGTLLILGLMQLNMAKWQYLKVMWAAYYTQINKQQTGLFCAVILWYLLLIIVEQTVPHGMHRQI